MGEGIVRAVWFRAVAACVFAFASVSARAQPTERAAVYRLNGSAEWAGRIESAGGRPLSALRYSSGVHRDRLLALHRAEDLVRDARRAAGRFDEAGALRRLVEARGLVETHADVPGSSQWLAEVELTLGLVAAQAGLDAIADESFRRAAALDPERVIAAAEAAPTVVARATAAAAVQGLRALGTLPIASPVGARVFLDDREIGRVPLEVRARAGRHVLRIEFEEHVPWGQVLDVREGVASSIRVRLASRPEARARDRLAALEAPDPRVLSTIASELGHLVWWVDATEERALLLECGPVGCAAPVRLGAFRDPGPPIPEARVRAQLRHGRAWMHWRPGVVDPPPGVVWWKRWPLWVGVGAAVAAGAVGVGVALRPEPDRQRVLIVDTADLL